MNSPAAAKNLKSLWPPSRKGQCILAGAVLGAAAFFLLYGFSVVNPANDAWIRGGYVEKDIIQHYLGWLYYRKGPWTFPIGVAPLLNWPEGAYVGLADSIPLFAVFFKLLSPLLPATFQYFGLWALLCSILQGAAAALLLSLYTTNPVRNGLLCLLFIFAPILLDRQLRHSALGAQWLILLALYLYIKNRRENRYFTAAWPLLGALAMAIHPYFVPMVLAILFALLVHQAVGSKKPGPAAAYLLITLAAILLTGFLLGAFSGAASGGSTPYGYFSMNLNALHNPRAHSYHWSILLPAQNLTRGNLEGFNYLGLGVLAGLAIMGIDLLAHFKKWKLWAFLKRHMALAFVCVCLAAFAVSVNVSANGADLFYIPLPRAILDLAAVLRSSGRMFYPVWYLLVLAVCAWLCRRPPPRFMARRVKLKNIPLWRTGAITLLVALQLLDISPALIKKHNEFHPYTPFFASELQSPLWEQVAGKYSHLASLDAWALAESIDMALYTWDNGMTTDNAFLARYDPEARAAQTAASIQALRTGTFNPDTIYITSSETTFLDLAEDLCDRMYCAQVDEHWYVFVPYKEGFASYTGTDNRRIEDWPLTIAPYSDANWDEGVLITDKRTVCFYNSLFVRRRVEGMAALEAGGRSYNILDIRYETDQFDTDWMLVTLDIQDATVLQGVPLQSVPPG